MFLSAAALHVVTAASATTPLVPKVRSRISPACTKPSKPGRNASRPAPRSPHVQPIGSTQGHLSPRACWTDTTRTIRPQWSQHSGLNGLHKALILAIQTSRTIVKRTAASAAQTTTDMVATPSASRRFHLLLLLLLLLLLKQTRSSCARV